MGSRIDWVIGSCRLLAAIGDEFERTRPFEGRRIGTGIHLEPKTVALLLTLVRGAADVVSTGNLNTTQQSAIDYLSEQFAENRHAVGQSVLESLLRITNRATNGRRVTVFGYGACGKGISANLRNAYAVVSVVEVDPVLRLEALLDGFLVPDRESALAEAEIVVTATGAEGVVTGADLALLRDGVILANAGHFPREIDVEGIVSDPSVDSGEEAAEGVTTLRLVDGRRVHVLANGHMVNLAGPRPLGNSIESMDLGFALQARCLEAVARGVVGADSCVVPVPPEIDAVVADAFVRLASRA